MLIEQDTSKNSYTIRLGANMAQMGCKWKTNCSIPFTRLMFTAITQYLAELRSKDGEGTYAVELHNDYQNPDSAVIFAAVLEKHDAAEGAAYSLSFTFDGEDVPADAKHINITDAEPVAFIAEALNRSIDVYNNERFQFNFNVEDGGSNKYSLFMSFRGVVITLKEYARNNVMNEDHNFEFKGYFTLTASVADDGKVFVKIVPSEGLKQIIKDDSSIEKHEDGSVSFAA